MALAFEAEHIGDSDSVGLEDVRTRLQDEVRRRWMKAAREVKSAIVMGDALQLATTTPRLAQPTSIKAEMFRRWLDEQLQHHVIGTGAWVDVALDEASARAVGRSRPPHSRVPRLRRGLPAVDAQQSMGFLQQGFMPPSRPVCKAATRGALAGVCSAISESAHRLVAANLPSRPKPMRIARLLDAVFADGLRRTRMLAEHSITMAYNQSSLDALEALGFSHVAVIDEHRHGKAGAARQGVARLGDARRGWAWHGAAGLGAARQGAAADSDESVAANLGDAVPEDYIERISREPFTGHSPEEIQAAVARRLRETERKAVRDPYGLRPLTAPEPPDTATPRPRPVVVPEVERPAPQPGPSGNEERPPQGEPIEHPDPNARPEEADQARAPSQRYPEIKPSEGLAGAPPQRYIVGDPEEIEQRRREQTEEIPSAAPRREVSPAAALPSWGPGLGLPHGIEEALGLSLSKEVAEAREEHRRWLSEAYRVQAEERGPRLTDRVTRALQRATERLEALLDRLEALMLADSEVLFDFDPDEPRDERGRWTTGGAEGFTFVSPNVGQADWPSATAALSERERRFRQASDDVDRELGLSGARTAEVIGAWSDGAERSLMTEVDGADWEKLRLAAAIKGHLGDQKAILAFQEGHPEPNAAMFSFPAHGVLSDIHQGLLDDGIAFHTLEPTADGAIVHVVDTDRSLMGAVEKAAGRYGAEPEYREGRAEFIGTVKEDGTDREQRDDARRVYEEAIRESAVPQSRAVWERLHHRWAASLAHDALTLDALWALFDANPHRHPRTGRFTTRVIALREKHRHKKTGRFQQQLPTEEVQAKAERAETRFRKLKGRWDVLTKQDDKVCKRCEEISDNGPYRIATARSLIPAHPHCRCVFVPYGQMGARDEDETFFVEDYDPSEPRNEQGEWTSGFTAPEKTVTAYKLFETHGDKLFPLFIGRKTATPVGEWIPAQYNPTKGYAERPGWHAGQLPIAPHLRTKAGTIAPGRVWAEVELPADVDWQAEADKSRTHDIRGKVPVGGHYRFKTSKMQGGAWMIGGAVKVKRVLSDPEVASILRAHGYPETEIAAETHGHVHDEALWDFDSWDDLFDYDPDEPRDPHGRWTTEGTQAEGEIVKPPELTPQQKTATADHALAVARANGFPLDRLELSMDDKTFDLNGKKMTTAGEAYSRDPNGKITIFLNHVTPETVGEVTAHEIEHMRYGDYDRKWRAELAGAIEEGPRGKAQKQLNIAISMLKAREQAPNLLPEEKLRREAEVERWKKAVEEAPDDLMNADGTLKPPYDAKYPTYQAHTQWQNEVWRTSEQLPEALRHPVSKAQNILATTDGVSDYSHDWWQAWWNGTATEEQAIHETLAEMASARYRVLGTSLEGKKFAPMDFRWTGPLLRHHKSKEFPEGFATSRGSKTIMETGAKLWNRLFAMVNPDVDFPRLG